MVIGIHTCGKCGLGNWQEVFTLLTREIINVAVPLFLTLSGFLLSRKSFNSNEDCIRFWKKQIPKVYIPCIVWSLPLFIGGIINGKSLIRQSFLLFSGGYSIYYFIPLIIQCYLFLPLFKKWSNVALGVGSFFITLCSAYLISYHGGHEYPFLVYMAPITSWILFFALGIILGKSERNYPISILVVLTVVALVLQIAESLFQKSIGIPCPYDCTKPSSILYAAFLIILLFSKHIELYYDTHRVRFIEHIGEISFTLYLGHCYLIMALNIANLANWFTVLLLSTICVYLLRKLVVNKTLRYILGL